MGVIFNRIEAQEKSKNITIKTNPPGVMIYFEGENGFVGVTPLTLKSKLIGTYKITAVKSGYEKTKLEYFFKGTESGTMRFNLSPRTRFKAGIRSLVFPGWGQRYSERKWTGILFSIAQLGLGIYTYDVHRDYEKAIKDYNKALDIYEENIKNSQLREKYYTIALDKYHKADDAFEKRQTWLAVFGGVWLFNFLDSIFFFPSFDRDIFKNSIPLITTNVNNDSYSLTLTMPF
jgi:tetratricopeptide (TPR) repeat protein